MDKTQKFEADYLIDIEEMKARKNVKALIKALKYKRNLMPMPISGVTLWMAEQGNHRAMQAVLAVNVRMAVAKALGEIGDNRAKNPLIAVLKGSKEKENGVREAVREALIKLGLDSDQLDTL